MSVGMSLVISTSFPFERTASVYAGPKEIKSTGSSSKSSSKETVAGGGRLRRGASIWSPGPHDGWKTRRKLVQSSGPALSNGASLGL